MECRNQTGASDQKKTYQLRGLQPTIYNEYNSRISRTLGVIQIIGGILAVSVNSVTLAMQEEGQRYMYQYDRIRQNYWGRYWWIPSRAHYVAVGFWGSVLFILSGCLGTCAGRWRTKRIIRAYHVTSHLSYISAAILICISVWAIIDDWRRLAVGFEFQRHWTRNEFPHKEYSAFEYDYGAQRLATVSLVFSGCGLLVALVLFATSIWSAILGVKILCRGHENDNQPCFQYRTNPDNESHVVVLDLEGRPIGGVEAIQIREEPMGRSGDPNDGRQAIASAERDMNTDTDQGHRALSDGKVSPVSIRPPEYSP